MSCSFLLIASSTTNLLHANDLIKIRILPSLWSSFFQLFVLDTLRFASITPSLNYLIRFDDFDLENQRFSISFSFKIQSTHHNQSHLKITIFWWDWIHVIKLRSWCLGNLITKFRPFLFWRNGLFVRSSSIITTVIYIDLKKDINKRGTKGREERGKRSDT